MKIFMSAPFTQLLTERGAPIEQEFRGIWDCVIAALETAGHSVFSAHRREGWGAELNTPEVALTADLHGLDDCDLVVAYIGSPPSPGVQLELGYALAKRRRMLIFINRLQPDPYLVRGLPAVGDAVVIEIDDIYEILDALVARGVMLRPSCAGASREPHAHDGAGDGPE